MQRFSDLLQRVALHFDLGQDGRADTGAFDRGTDAAANGDVVVLDQHTIVQTQTVITRPAHLRRMLFQRTQAGQGFTRIDQYSACALDALDILRGQGGDTGEMLQKIEHGALGSEQTTRRTRHHRQGGTSGDMVTILDLGLIVAIRHPAAKDLTGDIDTGDHHGGAGIQHQLGTRRFGNDDLGSEIGKTDVLFECSEDQLFNDQRINHESPGSAGDGRR